MSRGPATSSPVRAPGHRRRRRLDPPGQVRLRRPPQHPQRGLPGQGLRHEPGGRRGPRRRRRVADIDDLPDGEIDLVFVCTPAAANPDLLRACAGQGHHRRLRRLGRLPGGRARGPSGRGRAGRPAPPSWGSCSSAPTARASSRRPVDLCAQIVAPYPPAGRIGIASQSGNFVSSFMNWAQLSGIGVSRAVSAGNSAAVNVPDFLEFYARRPRDRGRPVLRRGHRGRPGLLRPRPGRRGREAPGRREGRGHRQRGRGRRPATPARWPPTTPCSTGPAARPASPGPPRSRRPTRRRPPSPPSPCPRGPGSRSYTTAGGWGVVTADAIARSEPRAAAAARRPEGPRSTSTCRPAGAATTRSTWPAARPGTRSRR